MPTPLRAGATSAQNVCKFLACHKHYFFPHTPTTHIAHITHMWTSATLFRHTLFLHPPTRTSQCTDTTAGSYKTHTRNAHLWVGCGSIPVSLNDVLYLFFIPHMESTSHWPGLSSDEASYSVRAGTEVISTWKEWSSSLPVSIYQAPYRGVNLLQFPTVS